MEYKFDVKTTRAGQLGRYQDSVYEYEVISDRPNYEVKAFCMNVIHKSYEPKNMPDPFVGKLVEFEKLTNNNKGGIFDPRELETYSYKVREMYTG